ncbi:MAG: hypothetical protein ACI8QS_000034 [Planctomycetota bacterium]|jgi:uncharacterized protein YndB with AHSA1/START domain
MSTESPEITGNVEAAEPLTVAEVRCDVPIDATPEKVWSVLVGDVSEWWHKSFYTNPKGPEQGGFRIEPKLGGLMVEEWGDGQGLIWGSVVGLETNAFLQIVGDSSPEWGGPTRNFMTFRLIQDGEGTQLSFTSSYFGRVTEKTVKTLAEGWRFLFGRCLKTYVETGSLEGVD